MIGEILASLFLIQAELPVQISGLFDVQQVRQIFQNPKTSEI
jgi:hypothetical protein